MDLPDVFEFTRRAVMFHRLRSALTALGIAIGVMAVILLTSLGEGLRQYMIGQFSQFGTHNITIHPGKSHTMGMGGVPRTQRPLTIADALAVGRLPDILASSPYLIGQLEVEANQRLRSTMVMGGTPEMLESMAVDISAGSFLPADNPLAPRPLAVIGETLAEDLFDDSNPVGQRIRVGGSRFQVIGVMAPKGNMVGYNLDETILIPTARSLQLFNARGLFGISVRYSETASVDEVTASIHRLLLIRHGVEDFTVASQQQMLEALESILDVLTLAVAALGSISLLVGGVGIFTIMTIAVRERTTEIGLLRSIGSTRIQVLHLFLTESVLLAGLGGVLGLLLAGAVVLLLRLIVPSLPVQFSLPYIAAAVLVSMAIGLLAGVAPAQRAAGLDPLEALRAE